jgi:hypothetical protein
VTVGSGAMKERPWTTRHGVWKAGTRGSGGGEHYRRMEATSRTRGCRWGIPPNRWQALEWPSWNTILGLLWADLDFGPIIKVVNFMMPYKFHLSTMVIRPTD